MSTSPTSHPFFYSYADVETDEQYQSFYDVITRVRFGGISPATKFGLAVVDNDNRTISLYVRAEDVVPKHVFQIILDVGEDITPRTCTYCGRPLAEGEKSAHKICIDHERADRRRQELKDEGFPT